MTHIINFNLILCTFAPFGAIVHTAQSHFRFANASTLQHFTIRRNIFFFSVDAFPQCIVICRTNVRAVNDLSHFTRCSVCWCCFYVVLLLNGVGLLFDLWNTLFFYCRQSRKQAHRAHIFTLELSTGKVTFLSFSISGS